MLEVSSVCAGYGRLQVLFDVSLSVAEGEAVALVGQNGAGKTTLVSAIAGFVACTRGKIALAGRDITREPSHMRARSGLAVVPSGRALFGSLSVEKNLILGQLVDRDNGLDLDAAWQLFPEIERRRSQPASALSGGEQQMVAVARALLGRPRCLVLDEPSLGLAPIAVERLYGALDELKARGQTLLIIEEKTEFVIGFADRYVVFKHGEVAGEGAASELGDGRLLQETYLG
jgi:branched-chain amino acid transport system ATP-binding protein